MRPAQINAVITKVGGKRRRGSVFPDRYHQEIIDSPRQARNALAYVLNNWRKHREDQARFAGAWLVDPFSTGVLFAGWKERASSDVMWKPRTSTGMNGSTACRRSRATRLRQRR